MEREGKKSWKLFSNIVFSVLAVVIFNAAVWIFLHGIPLLGLPDKADVASITIVHSDLRERTISDSNDIELLVNAANLLNYRFFGKKEGNPVITITYHLKDNKNIIIGANDTTMWWHEKSYSIKETDMFVKVIEGLFFSLPD